MESSRPGISREEYSLELLCIIGVSLLVRRLQDTDEKRLSWKNAKWRSSPCNGFAVDTFTSPKKSTNR
jgi:hypothetical protein